MLSLVLLVAFAVLSSSAASPAEASASQERPEHSRHFEAFDADGAFVLYDPRRDTYVRYNPERARRRFIPASTFKIVNSLIALETGVIAGEDEVLAWDGVDRGRRSWNRDHDLASAFRDSAVWFYQELARRIGEARMRDFVTRLGYGNQDVRGAIDSFWLNGEIAISAEEQIDLLRRLESGDLPFAPQTMATVRRIMRVEEGDGYVIRGKTGWARPDGIQHGWYVGWVEKGEDVTFFALQVSSPDRDFPMFRARREILHGILEELGVLGR